MLCQWLQEWHGQTAADEKHKADFLKVDEIASVTHSDSIATDTKPTRGRAKSEDISSASKKNPPKASGLVTVDDSALESRNKCAV